MTHGTLPVRRLPAALLALSFASLAAAATEHWSVSSNPVDRVVRIGRFDADFTTFTELVSYPLEDGFTLRPFGAASAGSLYLIESVGSSVPGRIDTRLVTVSVTDGSVTRAPMTMDHAGTPFDATLAQSPFAAEHDAMRGRLLGVGVPPGATRPQAMEVLGSGEIVALGPPALDTRNSLPTLVTALDACGDRLHVAREGTDGLPKLVTLRSTTGEILAEHSLWFGELGFGPKQVAMLELDWLADRLVAVVSGDGHAEVYTIDPASGAVAGPFARIEDETDLPNVMVGAWLGVSSIDVPGRRLAFPYDGKLRLVHLDTFAAEERDMPDGLGCCILTPWPSSETCRPQFDGEATPVLAPARSGLPGREVLPMDRGPRRKR